MVENGRINLRQLTILVILFTVGSSILAQPSSLAASTKQDAWLAAILGSTLALLMVMLYDALGNRFPKMTLVEYSEILLGKWLGKAVSLLYCSILFQGAGAILRQIGDFVTTQIIPETPIQYIEILFLSIVIMAVRLGLEVFSRAAEIFFPWVIMLFLVLAITLAPEIHFENIQPVLEEGIKPLWKGAIPMLGSPFLELVLFLMIYPYVQRSNGIRKAFLTGTLIGGVILIIISLLTILVLGADLTARQTYPSMALAKKINIGGFLERLESIIAGIWFLTIFFKMTLVFYASLLSFAQTLKLKNYRFLSLPMGMIMLVFSLVLFPNRAYLVMFIREIEPFISVTFGLLMPLVLLGIAYFRNNRKNKKPVDRHG